MEIFEGIFYPSNFFSKNSQKNSNFCRWNLKDKSKTQAFVLSTKGERGPRVKELKSLLFLSVVIPSPWKE